MKVFSRISVALLAGVLFTMAQDAAAQSRRADDVRWSRGSVVRDDRGYDRDDRDYRRRDDDRYDNRRRKDDRWRYDNERFRREREAERIRRERARHIEWCQRHRNDRRCAELYRRGSAWCWDRNRDGRCDYVDFRRRDDRGVLRRDRGPEWERWLRSSGVDVEALLNQPR